MPDTTTTDTLISNLYLETQQEMKTLNGLSHYRQETWDLVGRLAAQHGFEAYIPMSSCELYIARAWNHISSSIRDGLFSKAEDLAFANNSLAMPPQRTANPMQDLHNLSRWCIEYKRAMAAPQKPPPESPITPAPQLANDSSDALDDYKTSDWFEKNTSISGDSLRKAVSDGKSLRSFGPKSQKRYSLGDAKRLWPSEFQRSKA